MEDLRLDIDAPNEKTKRIGAVALENKAPGESQINPDLKTRAIMFLNKYGKMLAFFAAKAGNRKLNFAPSLNDDGFAFDASACKVVAPISWFADERYNDHELLFANFHEIGHFLDMRTNPNAYLENFDYMEKKSESLAKDYAAKHSNALPYEKMKKKYYKELHDLYNVLDDIYVNNLVFQCNKFFDSGDGREDVETLYEKLGFSDADLTDLPLHRQFIMSLLRDEMLGKTHGESVVDERVSSVLSRPLHGQINMKAFINAYLKPHQGIMMVPKERYGWIKTLIEPKFLSLLELACEEQEQKEKQKATQWGEGQEGGGNNKQARDEDSFDPFGDENSRLNETDILDHGKYNGKDEEILDAFNESDNKGQKYDQDKAIERFDRENDISESERAEYERIESKISESRKKMGEIWDKLIGDSIEYRRTRIKDQPRGSLDMRRTIKEYPNIQIGMRTGNFGRPRIYERTGFEQVETNQSVDIDVSLLVDCSGSMDKSKIEAAKETVALFLGSISDFNQKLRKAVQDSTHTDLRVKTEVIRFGSTFDIIKHFEGQRPDKIKKSAEVIKSISQINGKLGWTCDDLPLKKILENLSSKDKQRIKDGKLRKIVFEITDGASSHEKETTSTVSTLAERGVIMIGFQIGQVNKEEQEIFERIWNSGQSNKMVGIHIGEDVSQLPRKLMEALKNNLNNIII